MKIETGNPIVDGLYVTLIYSGWKLLAWQGGEWWHMGNCARWTAHAPTQWLGPLPDNRLEYDL